MASEVSLSSAKTLDAAPEVEDALVARCRQGDPDAFAGLVSRYEGMVYGLASRLLGDPEEARDVAQEVFLQVFRALDRFEGRSRIKTWIYRIAVNQCRNRRRFWRRRVLAHARPIESMTAQEEARASSEHSLAEDPFASVARRERAARVQAALARLSFDHRAILLLRESDGLTGEEIAAALGIAEGTVKSRLARARDAFRLCLEREPGEETP